MVKDAGLISMEVPGLISGKFFCNIFVHLFYPMVTTLLKYLDPKILHLFGICLITL